MGRNKITKIYVIVAITLLLISSLFVLRLYYKGKIGIFADYSDMYHFMSLGTEKGSFDTNLPVENETMKSNVKFFGLCQIVPIFADESGPNGVRCPDAKIALEDPSLPGYYSTYIKNPDNLDIGAIEVSVEEPEGYICPSDMVTIKVKYCPDPGDSSAIDDFCSENDYVVADSVNPQKIVFEKNRVRNKNILLMINIQACSQERES